jgi:diguanylate cyclase (GGDEF)-like protein
VFATVLNRTRTRTMAGEVGRAFRFVLAVCVATLVGMSLVLGYVEFRSRPLINELEAGQSSVYQARSGLVDQETGLRAYVSTGEPQFLEPYTTAAPKVAAADRAMTHLTGREIVPEVIATQLAEQRWRDAWANPAQLPSTSARLTESNADLAAFLADGKRDFDAYRAANQRLLDLITRQLQAARLHQQELLFGAAGVLLAAQLLALAGGVRRRRALLHSVAEPVDELAAAAKRIATGDYSVTVSADCAPEELRALAADFGTMAGALQTREQEAKLSQEVRARRTAQLQHVVGFAREVAGSTSTRYVLRAAAQAAVPLVDASWVRIWLTDDTGGDLQLALDSRTDKNAAVPDLTRALGIGPVGRAAKYGRLATLAELEGSPDATGPDGDEGGTFALPLIVGARVIGVIEAHTAEQGPPADIALELMEMLSSHAATALQAARVHHDTAELSLTDALTGLANRRRFDQDLRLEVSRVRRYGNDLSLVLIDVDHFKQVNDTYGHTQGDAVLQDVADILRETIRTTDTAYRFGGDELAILARETESESGAVLAERLRAAFAERFRGTTKSRITGSFGVASLPAHAVDESTLFAAADAALYEAKAAGRNRVAVASDPDAVAVAAPPAPLPLPRPATS